MRGPSRSVLAAASTAILASFLTNCGGGGGGGHSAGTVGAAALHGQITFGPVHDANVEVFEVSSTGLNDASLGVARSGADGSFTVQLQTVPVGPMRVVVRGGTYTSEFDGSNVDLKNSSFSCLLDGLPAAGDKVSLTPITDMVNALTVSQFDGTKTLADAHAAARTLLAAHFGIHGDVETLIPSFAAADVGSEAFKYGLVLGALDALNQWLLPSARGDVIEALSRDVSDGRFDGQDLGVPVPLGSGILPSTSGTSDLVRFLTIYADTGRQINDQGIDPAQLFAMASAVRTGIADSSLTPAAVGMSAGSSGAISTLAFDGKQWVFIAARDEGVVAIDVANPEAASPEIKYWKSIHNSFPQQRIGGAIPLIGADHPQLLVYAYGSKHFVLVNAATGEVEVEGEFLINATMGVAFNRCGAYVAGGIADPGRDGVWLATADGYQFWNRRTRAFEAIYHVDCPRMLSENLGGDITHGILWCPHYQAPYVCDSAAISGIQLVDLGEDQSYFMEETAFDGYFRSKGLDQCAGGAVDSSLQVGIITNDLTEDVGFVNLATIDRKTESPPLLSTFTPASIDGAVHLELAPAGGIRFSGAAVDSSTHLVFFMGGHSTDIGVGLLQDPSAVPFGTWAGLVDWRYNTLSGYSHAGDPHSVGAVTNLTDSKTYGYLLEGSNRRVLQVNLADFLALAPDAASDGHEVSADLVALGVIINRDW